MASAMPTTLTPELEAESTSEFRWLETEFGDGYRQRAGYGINTEDQNVPLIYSGSPTNINALVTHFRERNYQSFTYTLPWESTEKKWTCKRFSVKYVNSNLYELRCELRREYDL